jgi:hypothetical protein
MMTTINDCITYDFSSHEFEMAGKLSFVDNVKIPFSIERIFYIYDVPSGSSRGAHAHKELSQIIICLSGKIRFFFSNGHGVKNRKHLIMSPNTNAIYLKPGIWRELKNLDKQSVIMVLASDNYKENDYIRNYKEFLNYKKN